MALAASGAEATASLETALGWLRATGCDPAAVAGTGLRRYYLVCTLRCRGASPRETHRAGLSTGAAGALRRFARSGRGGPLRDTARVRSSRTADEFAATVCELAKRPTIAGASERA